MFGQSFHRAGKLNFPSNFTLCGIFDRFQSYFHLLQFGITLLSKGSQCPHKLKGLQGRGGARFSRFESKFGRSTFDGTLPGDGQQGGVSGIPALPSGAACEVEMGF